ncbi:MAG: ABC transporter permease [Steroidobacteraceae bacterium]
MVKHYLVQALRSFWRFRITAGVNLLGLVLAVVCFVASYLYIDSLVRSDMHFPKAARTYILTQEIWKSGSGKIIPAYPSAGPPAAAYLRVDFPGLEAVARAMPLGRQSAAADDRKADVNTVAIDPEFLQIFDFDFEAGEPAAAVTSAHSAIVTERTAERLFGKGQALGRRILLQNNVEVTVTAVVGAVAQPSHLAEGEGNGLAFDILVPMQLVRQMKTTAGIGVPIDPDSQDWGLSTFRTYMLFPEDGAFTPKELLEQLPAFAERRANPSGSPMISVLGAVPVSHMALSYYEALYSGSALSVTAMIFLLDALILAIACINYANLAVAIATTRAKELGVRKVLGATRLHLMRQCLIEAALLGFTAVVLVVVLALLAIEPVNRALQTSFTFASLLKPQLWLMVAGLIAAISVIGGMYPALALARVRPVDALRAGSVRAGPRFVPTILVGVQFAAASFLLVVALVMAQQNRLLQERALRTDRDPVVVLGNNLNELGISFDTLREELLRDPNIEAVASAARPPWQDGGWHISLSRGAEAGTARVDTIFNPIGYHFFDAIGLKLLAGRLLDQEHGDEMVLFEQQSAGKDAKVVIDRGLAAALGWNDPTEAIDKIAYMQEGQWQLPMRIVGVVESGYPRLMGPNTASDIYALSPSLAGVPLIRVSGERVPEAVRAIDSTWDRLAPKVQIRRQFMDELFDIAYRNYARINSTLNGLCAFAFLIAVMGLSGLAIHVTTRRRREIGIRKTLGATAGRVVTMLLADFAKPVLIANLIAWPFAWFVAQQYIDRFTQQSEMTIWPFVLSLAITVGVASASVAYQALRAATVKPANVLYAE